MDLLEKFKIAICKQHDSCEDIDELAQAIEDRSHDSKIMISDLKHELEKRGVSIRDAIYD